MLAVGRSRVPRACRRHACATRARARSRHRLVLLHTVRTQLDHFQFVIPKIHAFTVFAVDFPGMGWSGHRTGCEVHRAGAPACRRRLRDHARPLERHARRRIHGSDSVTDRFHRARRSDETTWRTPTTTPTVGRANGVAAVYIGGARLPRSAGSSPDGEQAGARCRAARRIARSHETPGSLPRRVASCGPPTATRESRARSTAISTAWSRLGGSTSASPPRPLWSTATTTGRASRSVKSTSRFFARRVSSRSKMRVTSSRAGDPDRFAEALLEDEGESMK